MKRITFLLLSFLMAVLYPNPVSAQNSTLTLSVSDTPLNEILNKIEKKTSYSFQYSTQVIDVRQKRSIHVKNQPIEAVLNILLKGTDIQYHIKGKQIILNARKKETKKAPEKSKGIVMDSKTREPIIGASITVEGEKTGAISDIDGRFEIEAPEHSRLCVSYMGYVTQLVPVKANKPIGDMDVGGHESDRRSSGGRIWCRIQKESDDCHCPGETGKDSTSGNE